MLEAPDGIEYRNPGIMESQIFTVLSKRFKSGRLSFSKIGATCLAKICTSKVENKWVIELEKLEQPIEIDDSIEQYMLEIEKNLEGITNVFRANEKIDSNNICKQVTLNPNNPILQASYRKKSRKKINFKSIFPSNIKIAKLHSHYSIISFIIVFLFVVLFCNKKIFAKSNTPKYELNNNAFNIQKIVSANANINTFKEQTITEFNIVYSKIYNNNSTLPKGEEIVTKPGVFGKKKISSVKTWENGSLVNEVVLSEETLSLPSSEYIDVGTSEFLAKYSVHIGDKIYKEIKELL